MPPSPLQLLDMSLLRPQPLASHLTHPPVSRPLDGMDAPAEQGQPFNTVNHICQVSFAMQGHSPGCQDWEEDTSGMQCATPPPHSDNYEWSDSS